jgi:phage tail sheath protein FI
MYPAGGAVCWGARTLEGSEEQNSEWKYVPVRRFALYLEESIDRGTRWATFEPNSDSLWTRIRSCVSDFMHNLYVKGAFQGATPQQAYVVKCDRTTISQDDVRQGKVNILVGFAPLRPAEFVFLRIQKLTVPHGK